MGQGGGTEGAHCNGGGQSIPQTHINKLIEFIKLFPDPIDNWFQIKNRSGTYLNASGMCVASSLHVEIIETIV